MRVVLLSLLLLSLAACVSKPTQYLTQQPIEVNDQTVHQYWKLESGNTFTFGFLKEPPASSRIANKKAFNPDQTGYFVVRFLIDSNGNTFDPEIIESEPAYGWDKVAKKAVAAQKFIPAESNELKIPVYYSQKLTFL
jgi:TonB family protein